MKKISKNSKILNITHYDLDGSVCAIILGHVFDNLTILDASFYKIDSMLESLDYDKYDYVILTDINPNRQKSLEMSDKIIMLDHHESAIQSNDPSKMQFVITGKCGAHLTKKFVEKYFKIDLSHLDDLVRYTNIYDMWDKENPEFPYAKKINDLMFYLYRPKKFRDKFFDGRTYFTEEEDEWLEQREIEFKNLYESLSIFEFEKINGCVVQSKEFINEICDKIMTEECYDIVFVRNPYHGRVSVRHKIEDLNIGDVLSEHDWGGGHAQSAGMFCSDMEDFQNKISVLEDELSKKYPK